MIHIHHPIRIAIVVLGILGAGLVALHVFARFSFKAAYNDYAEVAQRHDDAAYIPAVADNDIRKELNIVLARILTEEMSESDRLSLARRGQALLEAAEVQIDDIGEIGSDVSLAIKHMRESADIPGALHTADDMRDIIALSEERFRIIGDIRGLSYKAQFTTGQIFKQVIDDGGALDAQYVAKLNKELPEVEEQYNMRTNFYSELESVEGQIQAQFADFGGVF